MNWKPPEGQPVGQVPSGWQTTSPETDKWSTGKKVFAVLGVFVVLAVIGAAVGGSDDDRSNATVSVSGEVAKVCPNETRCGIRVDRVGDAYRFVLLPDATDDGIAALGAWAGVTGCLESVDFGRIEQTRAIDGMVESANGRSTWTYHPDDGLTIVCA